MTKTHAHRRLIYLMFFISGSSALIYEVVWLRILVRMLGCTVYATSTVLGVFMAGLALGSYSLGKYVDRSTRLLRWYAFLELGIGASALAMPFVLESLIPLYRWVFTATGGAALPLVRIILVSFCLIVPTTLMGGTLPVLSGLLAREQARFGSQIGFLYGLNTLGAILGAITSGFVLLGQVGEFNTILVGIAGNLCAFGVAYYLDSKRPAGQPATSSAAGLNAKTGSAAAQISPYSGKVRQWVIVAFGLSGFAALGYEVVWTRILQLFLETSVYAFSAMLIIYLAGIALGSLWARRFVDKMRDPLLLFAGLEITIAVFGMFGLWVLPGLEASAARVFPGRLGRFGGGLVAAGVLIFPVTLCLGVVFPTASRCFTSGEGKVGESMGRLYSFNTIGCILGSLACGFALIPALGSTGTVLALSGLNLVLGVALLATDSERLRQLPALTLAGAGIAFAALMTVVMHDPVYRIIERRVRANVGPEATIYLHRENVTATTTAFGSKTNKLNRHLWINGVGMTSLVTETKLIAHLPLLLCPNPKNMLIICFGMGTTLRSALVHDRLNIQTVELVPEVYEAFPFYHREGAQLLHDPRVHPYVDDGRNYLLMRDQRYDVIAVDPPPPIHSAGTVNLYSREFVSLCRQHLAPSGVCCLWVPPDRASEIRMIMRTFQSVFPHATVWRGLRYPGFYLIGTEQPLAVPLERFRQAFKDPRFLADLLEWDQEVNSAEDLANLLLLDETQLSQYVQGVPVITDNHPYTEFPLWRLLLRAEARKTCNAPGVLEWKTEKEMSARP